MFQRRHSITCLAVTAGLALSAAGLAGSGPVTATDTSVPAPVTDDSAPPTSASESASDGTVHEEGPPAGATEVEEPMPRLAVADAESGAVELVDLVAGETLTTFEATGPAYLANDGRFVYATDYEGGAVTVIDTGSWVGDHGDHIHAYTAEPAVVGVLEGENPAHVVPNEGFIPIFFDGTGTAEVLTEEALESGDVEPALTIATDSPHHGVVIAFAGHFAVSIPGPTSEDLPIGVEVRHADGEVEAAFEECPDLHGEAGFAEGVLFACADGLLWVTGSEGSWDAEKLPYPVGTPADARTWSFAHAHGVPVVAGALGDNALIVVDTETAEVSRIDLPVAPVDVAIAEDGASLVGLTADGQLHVIDAASGTIVSSGPVTGEVDLDAEDGPPTPSVVVVGDRAYVSDPVAGTVLEVDFNDGMRIARTIDVEVVPAGLAVTGTS